MVRTLPPAARDGRGGGPQRKRRKPRAALRGHAQRARAFQKTQSVDCARPTHATPPHGQARDLPRPRVIERSGVDLSPSFAKRLKGLERENATLKRVLADAELHKVALKEIAKGNF